MAVEESAMRAVIRKDVMRYKMWNVEFGMRRENLKERTKQFAIEIIKLVETLPKNWFADVFGKQLLRSGTSVGANYRSACRAKSRADFI